MWGEMEELVKGAAAATTISESVSLRWAEGLDSATSQQGGGGRWGSKRSTVVFHGSENTCDVNRGF